MHIVATNIILWIRTLIKETMEEVTEIGEKHLKKELTIHHYTVKMLLFYIVDNTYTPYTSFTYYRQ